MVGEGLVAAWLEGGGIAVQSRVEIVDGRQNTVGVLASAAIVDIDYRGQWL